MMGNRGVYHDGWWANTTPKRMPWGAGAYTAGDPADYQWELYDLTKDPAQSHNLAASNPKKLAEMQAIFDQEAEQCKDLRLDGDRNVFFPQFDPLRVQFEIMESIDHAGYTIACAGNLQNFSR